MSTDPGKDSVISADDRNRAAVALAEAMGRAREQNAVRDTMRTDARVNAQQRLEILRQKLSPVFEAVPRDAEQFNLGVISAEKPRFYIDIIGFVEMTPHQKAYRLVQETRRGVQTIGESAEEAGIMSMVTDYIARRLVERERAMAGAAVPVVFKANAVQIPLEQIKSDIAPDVATQAVTSTPSNLAGPIMGAAIAATSGLALPPSVASAPVSHALDTMASPARFIDQAVHNVYEHGAAAVATVREPVAVGASQPAMTAAHMPVASNIAVLQEAPVVSGVPVASILNEAEAGKPRNWRAAKPIAAAAVVAASGAVISGRTTGGGSWVWALMSLLIGIGIGALMLYLYAASLGRP